MNWKTYLTAFISSLMVAFPQNMIGCGPDSDDYDYHIRFFQTGLIQSTSYKPFHYSRNVFMYGEDDQSVSRIDILSKEWADYCGQPVKMSDATEFVFSSSIETLRNLYDHIEKNVPLKISGDFYNNTMTRYFIEKKDIEGLGYLLFAKQVEPYVTGEYSNWEPIVRDSVKMSRLIKNGMQLYHAAKKDFYKLKYGYQLVRLAHYSKRFQDAIDFYDRLIVDNKTSSILQMLSLAHKAGSLARIGKSKEAVYLFSKAFSATPLNRYSNFISFNWNIDAALDRSEYLSLCSSNKEKANMMAMFAMHGTQSEINSLRDIYVLYPQSDALELLAIREINKLEESYYSPNIQKQSGGKSFYYNWYQENNNESEDEKKRQLIALSELLHQIAAESKVSNPILFETGASYTAYMNNDLNRARLLLDKSFSMKPAGKIKDQCQMINLLIAIGEADKVDKRFEERMLPSLQWLAAKADLSKEFSSSVMPDDMNEWRIFQRNFYSEILAKRYHRQADKIREVLAVAVAEKSMYASSTDESFWGLDFMRKNLMSDDLQRLYKLMTAKKVSAFDRFLINNSTVKLSHVIDFTGTAYLRDHQFAEAIKWFSLNPNSSDSLPKNPFIDLLYDREEKLAFDNQSTSKLAFAREMLELQKKSKKDKSNAATHLYKMALGFYNTTYYGYTWELVEYYRSGSDGYRIPDNANDFQRNYYGCFTAHDYFKMAMDASDDPSFKARCLFMMAKCKQKQEQSPTYQQFGSNYIAYSDAEKMYYMNFFQNEYFPEFVEKYRNTPFFQEAYNSCSYLRDFVKEKK